MTPERAMQLWMKAKTAPREGPIPVDAAAVEAILAACAEERKAALTEAEKAVRSEEVMNDGNEGDTAYNLAVTHCSAAIVSLIF